MGSPSLFTRFVAEVAVSVPLAVEGVLAPPLRLALRCSCRGVVWVRVDSGMRRKINEMRESVDIAGRGTSA